MIYDDLFTTESLRCNTKKFEFQKITDFLMMEKKKNEEGDDDDLDHDDDEAVDEREREER